MQLKGFNKRLHNIFFHTHTVSGIVISFALFIIFFAGAFSLFRDEAYMWGNPDARYEIPTDINVDRAFKEVLKVYPDFDQKNDISFALPTASSPELNVYGYNQRADSSIYRVNANVNTQTYKATSFEDQKTHMMETIYHLHYFGQIPVVGLYLSGLTALFFFFATITGLLVHWKNIIEKFYALRTKAGWKNLWKDAHTTLGLIGLPFQVIYGITGALLGLSILLLAPSVLLLFNGSQDEVRGMLDPFFSISVNKDATPNDDMISLDEAFNIVKDQYPDFKPDFLRLRNYGTEEAAMSVRLSDRKSLGGAGSIVVSLNSGEIIKKSEPLNKGYNAVYDILIQLHYATFGGIWMKVIYFLLALLTCFIIISGILLWQSARDNKKYTDKQRKFHHRVTKVYLNICFSLFPATAIIFIANMLVPLDMAGRVPIVDTIFFVSWLVLALSAWMIDSYRNITWYHLLLGGILSLCVPLANGLVTGDWIWTAWSTGLVNVAMVDIFWLIIGSISLSLSYKYNRKSSNSLSSVNNK